MKKLVLGLLLITPSFGYADDVISTIWNTVTKSNVKAVKECNDEGCKRM